MSKEEVREFLALVVIWLGGIFAVCISIAVANFVANDMKLGGVIGCIVAVIQLTISGVGIYEIANKVSGCGKD